MVIFFIWTRGKEKLKTFMEDINNFTTNLKFTLESDKNNISLLDLNGQLLTDLHIKPTHRHQYLHSSSSHPEHTKLSIVYSQTLKTIKLYFREKDFQKHKVKMKP